ncbi:MAG TPA: DoxX family protein [Tepidisphaeraceae bacterium]|jgi:putative oxidoreductase|nr:DoxX family protein [Tepidisphaeraceae bacterium]
MSQFSSSPSNFTAVKAGGTCCRWAVSSAGGAERVGIMLVRLMVGVAFAVHGYQKWFIWHPAGTVAGFGHMGFPPAAAYTAMTAELVCGVLLILGLFTRFAAIPIVITMIVAIVKVHLHNGFFVSNMGYEYALTLGVAALALVLAGPGTLAVDDLIAGKRG